MAEQKVTKKQAKKREAAVTEQKKEQPVQPSRMCYEDHNGTPVITYK